MFTFVFSEEFSIDFDSVVNDIDVIVIPDYPYPVSGLVVISDVDGQSLTVTRIIRYNGSGRFTCALTDGANYNPGMDVYYSNENLRWQAKPYIPERYRDEEGVLKNM